MRPFYSNEVKAKVGVSAVVIISRPRHNAIGITEANVLFLLLTENPLLSKATTLPIR